MTLARTIILDAYRETNLIAEGDAPSAAQEAEGLRRLQAIVNSLFGNEVGENLEPRLTPDPYRVSNDPLWIEPNTRIVCNLTVATPVSFPAYPNNGSRMGVQDMSNNFATTGLTLSAGSYTIEGAKTLTLSKNSFNGEWMFRADLGDWRRIADITLDEMPFPPKFDDFFVTTLAMRINPRNGVAIHPETAEIIKRGRSQIRAEYRQPTSAQTNIALLRLPHRPYPYIYAYQNTEQVWDRGYPC